MRFDRKTMLAAGCAAVVSAALLGSVAAPARAAGVLDALTSGQRTLVVGTDATFPPFEYTTAAGQKIGFDIDLVNALAKRIGIKKVSFVQVPFGGLVPGLVAHHIDMAASAIYITAAREKVVDFSAPYFTGGLSVMVKPSDTTITSEKALDGKRVAVQVGTKSVNWLQQHVPSARLVIVQANDQMFLSLQNGQADAVVTGYPAARYYIKTHGGAKMAPFLLTHEAYGYAFRKSTPELTKAVDQALAAFEKDGTLKSLEAKWFGKSE
ncbi:MAG TPA: transporter substrate-binding domain-containing protein [Candidatus Dormibacteraeota bacterium]|nr:transporter substrate-binding domain-containing protein [Candidatus Dormibacteraeota bacterium]